MELMFQVNRIIKDQLKILVITIQTVQDKLDSKFMWLKWVKEKEVKVLNSDLILWYWHQSKFILQAENPFLWLNLSIWKKESQFNPQP